MSNHTRLAGLTLLAVVPVLVVGSTVGANGPAALATPFPDARLRIEYNSTDGDAGLQILLDAPAWREISITKPNGRTVVAVTADEVIRNYGLTELFAESSEPPFDVFPFSEFMKLFPEGEYTFKGRTIEGTALRSTFTLTHDVPDGPTVVSPSSGATVAPDDLVVEWLPVNTPGGIDVVAYQVLVVAEAPALGNPERVLDVMLPGTATRLPIPEEFLVPGEYKAEVLAIEESGNQTLTEVELTIE